jgi:lycopene beta-cyclase
MSEAERDYVLVGGGLQCGLLALALSARRPAPRLAIIEQADRLGGNHTWCFQDAEVPPALRAAGVAA